jgi:hypothetical protein
MITLNEKLLVEGRAYMRAAQERLGVAIRASRELPPNVTRDLLKQAIELAMEAQGRLAGVQLVAEKQERDE